MIKHLRRLSLTPPPPPVKMTHAEAAHLCTEIVLQHKGDPETTKKKCAEVRDKFFDQYRV